jgi:hypothetical protein
MAPALLMLNQLGNNSQQHNHQLLRWQQQC